MRALAATQPMSEKPKRQPRTLASTKPELPPPPKPRPPADQLSKAEAELATLERRWDSYSGNNPNKYQSAIRAARTRVASIKHLLKAQS